MSEEDLLRELPPPPELEERVVRALRDRGLIRARRRSWLQAAAAVVLLVLGFAAGRWEPPPSARSFALVLYDSPATSGASHVEEYIAWSRNDFVLGGHELGSEQRVLGTPTRGVGGFFIIAADSLERATEIARTCPHVRYGGTIEVREIVR